MITDGYKFDADGNMVETDVYIVWGSPASGKTTYVRENMEDGDLVVDLDLIKQGLSMASKTNAGDNLLDTALSVREHLYSLIERRQITCRTVWVVAGLPKKEDRDKLKARLRATRLIGIRATKQECIARAHADDERQDKERQVRIIEKWFKQFYHEGE